MAETERLLASSELYLINGTEMSVDVYVNYESEPTLSDPPPLAVGPTFVVDDTLDRPYGVYTFEVRLKGDPAGPVLAAASVDLCQGHSYTGVFHPTPEGGAGAHRLSIYENDLSDGTDARLTVRNASAAPRVDWSLVPNGENPRIPTDSRAGSLEAGQWQICRGITENDYRLEMFVDGERVAAHGDTNLGLEENVVIHLVGHPEPAAGAQALGRYLVLQELEYDVGPAVEDSTSAPAPPRSVGDSNAEVSFEVAGGTPVEVWEADSSAVEVTATDGDGVIRGLAVERVDPPVDGFAVRDGAFEPSPGIGQPARATLSIEPDVPDGTYTVRLLANGSSLAQSARFAFEVEVRRITAAHLQQQVDAFEAAGSCTPRLGDEMRSRLAQVAVHFDDDELAEACSDLRDLLAAIQEAAGDDLASAAAETLVRQVEALSADLGCD